MNIACPGCGTRYAVADEKVKGRRVRIACKHCSAPIIVDGTLTDAPGSPATVDVAAPVPPPVVAPVPPPVVAPVPPPVVAPAPPPVVAPAPPPVVAPAPPPVVAPAPPPVVAPAPPPVAAPAPPPVVAPAPPPVALGRVRLAAAASGAAPVPVSPKEPLPVPAEVARALSQRAPATPVTSPKSPALVAVPSTQMPVGAPPVAEQMPVAARQARAMRATIIGVPAPANPPPVAIPPAVPAEPPPSSSQPTKPTNESPAPEQTVPRTSVMPAVRRNLKRTMIGGLEAAPGSAPTPQAVGLGIPAEAKWTVLLAASGASVMSAPDMVRAFAEGKINRDSKLWREGLDGWKSLWEIEPVRVAFERAGLSLSPSLSNERLKTAEAAADLPRESTEGTQRRSRADTQSSVRPPATTEVAVAEWDGLDALAPDDGAPATTRLPTSAATPLRVSSVPDHPADLPQNESPLPSPTIGADIGPRETLRGQLRAVSSAPPTRREPSVSSSVVQEPIAANTLPPKARHKRPRKRALALLVWFLLVAAIAATLTLSYRARQPAMLYADLERRQWLIPIDRQVQRFVARPYRRAAKQLRGLFDRAK